jgi:hypothetical protein
MMEKRTPECLKDQQLCERYKKKAAEEAYFNPELSEEAKKLGNDSFRKDDFPSAVKHYTEAINRNPKNAALYRLVCCSLISSLFLFFLDPLMWLLIPLPPFFLLLHLVAIELLPTPN